jgi:hypothetical protein
MFKFDEGENSEGDNAVKYYYRSFSARIPFSGL